MTVVKLPVQSRSVSMVWCIARFSLRGVCLPRGLEDSRVCGELSCAHLWLHCCRVYFSNWSIDSSGRTLPTGNRVHPTLPRLVEPVGGRIWAVKASNSTKPAVALEEKGRTRLSTSPVRAGQGDEMLPSKKFSGLCEKITWHVAHVSRARVAHVLGPPPREGRRICKRQVDFSKSRRL